MKSGESLVTLDKVPALQSLSNTTRSAMANSGRIPAIRSGRRFLTLVSLVDDYLVDSVVETETVPQAATKSKIGEKHNQALASLVAKGFKPKK